MLTATRDETCSLASSRERPARIVSMTHIRLVRAVCSFGKNVHASESARPLRSKFARATSSGDFSSAPSDANATGPKPPAPTRISTQRPYLFILYTGKVDDTDRVSIEAKNFIVVCPCGR